jgi:hypothetical protein
MHEFFQQSNPSIPGILMSDNTKSGRVFFIASTPSNAFLISGPMVRMARAHWFFLSVRKGSLPEMSGSVAELAVGTGRTLGWASIYPCFQRVRPYFTGGGQGWIKRPSAVYKGVCVPIA